MGSQIIKQPNGLFAIFSSITDTIHVWDATAEEIEEYFVDRAAEQARREVRAKLVHVAADEPREAYYQFALPWERALAMDEEHGGEVWREFRANRSVQTVVDSSGGER